MPTEVTKVSDTPRTDEAIEDSICSADLVVRLSATSAALERELTNANNHRAQADVIAENTRLREALFPLAACAVEYFERAAPSTPLDTFFYVYDARKAATAMGMPTHRP